METKRRNTWIIAIIALLAIACGCLMLTALVVSVGGVAPARIRAARQVSVIDIDGVILYGELDRPFTGTGMTYSGQVVEQLEQMDADPRVAAIVLNINSPGGSVVGSADIHRAVVAVSKPIVASMGETAASGGYYVAAGADRIVTRPGTITGSIGVIMTTIHFDGLLEMLGIESEVIKSGPLKDMGSAYRPLTPEERDLLQAMIDEAYDDFVEVVAEGRDLSMNEVREMADGRILSGRMALDLGLADDQGNLDDAIALAAELGEIPGEPDVRRFRRDPSLMEILFGALAGQQNAWDRLLHDALYSEMQIPQLYYLHSGSR